MIAEKSPVLERAAARLIEVSEDENTRHRLESYRLFEMDHRVMINEARDEGIAQGITRGITQGIAQGILQTAATMKAAGFGVEDIIKATNLTADEVHRL